ncbi:hypothetical protein B0H10DRAFT_1964478 [Mycena sp. CBHHK59/15]|nr:hypothetical protein B0H10DRAFT_1964478 [Mycena sp. CBHHK59/15]
MKKPAGTCKYLEVSPNSQVLVVTDLSHLRVDLFHALRLKKGKAVVIYVDDDMLIMTRQNFRVTHTKITDIIQRPQGISTWATHHNTSRMPKQARQARHAHRGPAGGFASNQPLPETVEAASDAERSDDVLAWESDEESDAGEDDSEQWEQQPGIGTNRNHYAAGQCRMSGSVTKRKAVPKVAEVEEDVAGSNGFVHLFDAMSPLARVESDAERIEALLKSGEQKKTSKREQPPNKWELRLDEEHLVMEECIEFEVFCPAPNPNDPPVSCTHQWPRMIDSQLKRDGQLLHLHISARDLDPDIRPSATQSIVAVATKAVYEGLGAAQRHKLFWHRCVLVLEIGAEQPPAPFTPEMLERYKNLDEDADIQDCGLRTERDPGVGRVGKLCDLFNTTARGGRAILNALQNPQEYSQIPVPPGWPDFATHERSASERERIGKTSTQPDGIGLPTLGLPWAHLRWVIIVLLNAKSAAHQDVLTTVIQMITGWKLWAIGVPTRGEGKAGDFSSRHGFHGWQPHGSNTQFLRWEFILLGPTMCLTASVSGITDIALRSCLPVFGARCTTWWPAVRQPTPTTQ